MTTKRTHDEAVQHIGDLAEEIRAIARAHSYDPDTLMGSLIQAATHPEAHDLEELAMHVARQDRDSNTVLVLKTQLASILG